MNAKERREKILARLKAAEGAISASTLAAEFSVSRQIIVGDIALLRAAGNEILATPHGYICQRAESGVICQVVCRHDAGQMQEELNAIVDQGCTVLDVIVFHPIYGELTGQLNLSNRYEVATFIEQSQNAAAQPISVLTNGIHLHTLRCPDEAAAARVRAALETLGILMNEGDAG